MFGVSSCGVEAISIDVSTGLIVRSCGSSFGPGCGVPVVSGVVTMSLPPPLVLMVTCRFFRILGCPKFVAMSGTSNVELWGNVAGLSAVVSGPQI